jgi:hypothetical protein
MGRVTIGIACQDYIPAVPQLEDTWTTYVKRRMVELKPLGQPPPMLMKIAAEEYRQVRATPRAGQPSGQQRKKEKRLALGGEQMQKVGKTKKTQKEPTPRAPSTPVAAMPAAGTPRTSSSASKSCMASPKLWRGSKSNFVLKTYVKEIFTNRTRVREDIGKAKAHATMLKDKLATYEGILEELVNEEEELTKALIQHEDLLAKEGINIHA